MIKIKKKISRIGFYLLLALLFVNLAFPFYWALSSSLKSDFQLAMTPATLLPRDPTTKKISISFNNYITVLKDKIFMKGLLNSFIVAGTTTFLSIMFGSFAAFALGKLRFFGKKYILYVILSLTMFPQIAVLSGLYTLMNSLKTPARVSMILTYLIFSMPFTIWILTNFFKALPKELLESARVDGASVFQAFYMILLPLTAPALVTTSLLSFIGAWNEYLFALTFTVTDKASRTVPVAVAMFTGASQFSNIFGLIMAASVIVTVPLLVLVFIFQKRIVDGLTAGSVKG